MSQGQDPDAIESSAVDSSVIDSSAIESSATESSPRTTRTYRGDSESIAAARSLAGGFLNSLRGTRYEVPAALVADAQLVVSELVTNTVKYAPGPFILGIHVDSARVEVSVLDSSPAPPVPKSHEPERVGRHGLEIVLALCGSIDIRHEPVGKRVTARITRPGAESPAST